MQGGRTPACLHLQKRRARRANEQPATAHGEQSETASRPLPCLWLPAGRAGHACRHAAVVLALVHQSVIHSLRLVGSWCASLTPVACPTPSFLLSQNGSFVRHRGSSSTAERACGRSWLCCCNFLPLHRHAQPLAANPLLAVWLAARSIDRLAGRRQGASVTRSLALGRELEEDWRRTSGRCLELCF